MLSIKHFDDSYKTAWDKYVTGHPDGTVFHCIAWKQAIEQTFGHKSLYLLAIEDCIFSKGGSDGGPPESKKKTGRRYSTTQHLIPIEKRLEPDC